MGGPGSGRTAPTNGTSKAMAVSGLTWKQLDYWTRCGALLFEQNEPGTGHARELSDLQVLGSVIRQAREAGLTATTRAVADMWHAIQSGRPWRLVLDIGG